MQYLSPSTFIGETLCGPLDKKAIQLGRKKLFADLELSGETTVELQGKPFTKNDIIKYFDDLLKEGALAWHSAIGDDRVLLSFLEHAKMGRKEKFLDNPLYKDEQFIQWVSPYFSHAFNVFMDHCFLVEQDEDGLSSLVSNRLLMTPRDTERCWDAVTRFIMDDISTLERFNAQDKKRKAAGDVTPAQLKELMEFSYVRLIQLLPQGRFAPIRDKYAYCMLNACIDVFNSHVRNRSYARTWLENAELLAVSPDVKTRISKKIEEMDSLGMPEPGAPVSTSSSTSGTGIIKLVFFILLAFIKIATCNSGSSSSSYKYQLPTYPIDQAYIDSLLKSNKVDTAQLQASKSTTDTFVFTHKIKRHPKHK